MPLATRTTATCTAPCACEGAFIVGAVSSPLPSRRWRGPSIRATGRDAEAAPLVDEAVRVARASLPEQHSARMTAEALQAPTR